LTTAAALSLAGVTLFGYPLWNLLPLAPMSLAQEPSQLLWLGLALLLWTLPFAYAGLYVAKSFATYPQAAPWLYAWDLSGAAAGVVIYAVGIGWVGGPGMLAVVTALALGAALLAAGATLHRRVALALAITACLAGAPLLESLVPLRITPNKLMGQADATTARQRRRTRWTPGSALDVIRSTQGTAIVIDGGTAMTQLPTRQRIAGALAIAPPTGVRALPYRLAGGAKTLVIGSGGGVEVAAALGAGSREVLALEIDPGINQLVRHDLNTLLGGLFADPRVTLETAEARSYLAALPASQRFDVIVAFHTISNAASAGGGMALAESYMMTVEAFTLLLDRLSDDGVLLISRPEAQMPRLAAILATAWGRRGGEALQRHVAIVSATPAAPSFLTALLFRARPLDDAARAAVANAVPRLLFSDQGGDDHATYAAALRSRDGVAASAADQATLAGHTLRPAYDARPFFNLPRPWREVGWREIAAVLGTGEAARMRLEDLPVAQVFVWILLLAMIALAGGLLLPAVLALRRGGTSGARIAESGGLFAALGFGYIVSQVLLIQRLTLIVGEPGWSVVIVLGSMLLASGAGSAWLVGRRQWSATRGCGVAVLVVAGGAWGVPALLGLAAPAPFALRLVVAALIAGGTGLFLGVPFSAMLRQLGEPSLVAWAWALNSIAAVAGSIAALMIASAAGFPATALCAAAAYGLAAGLAHRGEGRARRRTADDSG